MMFLIVFSLSTVGLANEVALPDEVIDTEQVESVQQTNSSTISSGFNKILFIQIKIGKLFFGQELRRRRGCSQRISYK